MKSLSGVFVFLLCSDGLDLMERLFQGQLVLRTRCLECESFTERREDFQDISVPVLDDQPSSPDDLSDGENFACDKKQIDSLRMYKYKT